jgi:uncharacterized membrane protein (UPF0127 family)
MRRSSWLRGGTPWSGVLLVAALLLGGCGIVEDAVSGLEDLAGLSDDPETTADAGGDATTDPEADPEADLGADVGTDPGTGPDDASGPDDDDAAGASDVDGPADADGADAAADGSVPAMHPEIDDWPATVITFTTGSGDTVEVAARVADTPDRRQRGLMHVEDVPDGAGMLFVFEEEAAGSFWMKDTLVPLDIAFLGPDGDVRAVLQMEPCPEGDSCDIYSPDAEYLTAVEVAQGFFDANGVDEDATATWDDPTAP